MTVVTLIIMIFVIILFMFTMIVVIFVCRFQGSLGVRFSKAWDVITTSIPVETVKVKGNVAAAAIDAAGDSAVIGIVTFP